MATITLDKIAKRYGDTVVLNELSLTINDGEFVVLVGPSGCGKTTLLRMIAGLLEPSQGSVRIDGNDVTQTAPGDRDIAMVFQSYALYPHMSVRENIAFPLKVRRRDPAFIQARVNEVAQQLGLDPLLDRKPAALSGGQRQRVAMGRAIVREPKAFLFDEPLSNLDAALRGRMRGEIAALHRRLKATMVYVTHDQHEAMTLADRLVLLNKGTIEQMGAPLTVYQRPRTRFVAEFLGSPPMNFLAATRNGAELFGNGFKLTPAADAAAQPLPEKVWVGVRPEALCLSPRTHAVEAEIDWVERTGSDGFLYARVGDAPLVARLDASQTHPLEPGSRITLGFDELSLFDAESGRALGAQS